MNVFIAIIELEKWQKTFGKDCGEWQEYKDLHARLVAALESLPINQETIVRHPQGFVLVANEWQPVNVLVVGSNGWAEWRLDTDGGCEGGPVQPGKWAHATADNLPCLP